MCLITLTYYNRQRLIRNLASKPRVVGDATSGLAMSVISGKVSMLHNDFMKIRFSRIQKLPKEFHFCPVDTHFFKGDIETINSKLS